MANLAPFPYQEHIRDKVRRLGKTAVIAPPGAGKTRPAIEGAVDRGGFDGAALVLCTGAAIPTWKRQLPQWAPHHVVRTVVITGTPEMRRKLWRRAKLSEPGEVYIANFAVFLRDFPYAREVGWTAVFADEYHKVMRRPKSATFKHFKSMTLHIGTVVLLSGSLFRRNASSMYTAFAIAAPKVWSSYWRFVHTFCHVDTSEFGQLIYGVKNLQRLREVTDQYLAYIPEKVVADQLPEGLRLPLDCEITPEQARIIAALEKDLIAMEEDAIIITPNVLSKLTAIRQLLCCPKILDKSLGMGAGYETIIDHLESGFDEGIHDDRHCIIFVPFRPACDFIMDDLQSRGYANVFILRGGTSADAQAEIIQRVKDTRGILICTIQYAESFDMETCARSYFLGYDLTVDQNEQAEGRTRRAISQHKSVRWFYVKTNTDIDEHFLGKLDEDARNAHMVLGRPEEYIRKLKGGVDL